MNWQNPKFVLVAIGLLFFLPMLLAVFMRSQWWDFKPQNLSNRGQLVAPPVSILPGMSSVQYRMSQEPGRSGTPWIILYPFPGQCDHVCEKTVVSLRQIHLASGRDRDRVAIWLLSPHAVSPQTQESLVALYPRIEVRLDVNQQIFSLLGKISHEAELQYGQAYLLDPAANVILHYPSGFEPGDINKDLDRLLAWSGKD